ncbi:unnamed protein product, partial [Rotaria sp. Silwood2]
MLSKSLSDADKFVQLLDTSEKLKYVRTYAHLLNNVFYLKLEESFWEHYKQVCISESIWSSPMLKNIAKENNLCRFKFKTQVQLEKHYQLIQKRLRTTENNLNQEINSQNSPASSNEYQLATQTIDENPTRSSRIQFSHD